MGKGTVYPSEAMTYRDQGTGAAIRQVTNHPSIHHHPFFFAPAYDDAMRWLIFVSRRTGELQIFAEDRRTSELVQLTDRPDLNEWSVYPTHDGSAVLFTAGTGAWRLDLKMLEERQLAEFTTKKMRGEGMVGAAMGTTALSWDDRWWAVPVRFGDVSRLFMIDLETGEHSIILERDEIGHPQFCPDDPDLIFYAGPLTDRVWMVNRDGSNNCRLYECDAAKREWITHETWIPGRRELAFVDWPHGIRAVEVDTRHQRRVCSFNAWHAVCNRQGTLMAADTNFPDIGIQIFDPRDGVGEPVTVCHPQSSSIGEHWNGPFPYDNGPIKVYAPQHTHPHPSFSPDSRRLVFTSDRTGYSQVYEVEVGWIAGKTNEEESG
jgi:oligogalacturonide lyase